MFRILLDISTFSICMTVPYGINMVYESFILGLCCLGFTLTLVLVLWRLKVKYGLFSNHLLERKQEHGG